MLISHNIGSTCSTVANVSSRTSATNIMRDLHWLLVAQKIDYKLQILNNLFHILIVDNRQSRILV